MAGPIDAVVALHNAFRNDMTLIDAAALDAARGKPGLEATVERFREFVAWMFPLVGIDDRENMTRIWQMVMPADAFAGATALVKQAIGDEWAELAGRIPELAGAS